MLVILGICTSAYVYFYLHKKDIIRKVSLEINQKIQAKVTIRDADISWFATFPYLTIALKDICITDTINGVKSLPLLDAKLLYFNCNLIQLISGNINVNNIVLSDGQINFHRDSLGHSNLHILDQPGTLIKSNNTDPTAFFNALTLHNIRLYFSDVREQKNYDIFIKRVKCVTDIKGPVILYKVELDLHINFLGLYTVDGTYGRNKDLSGTIKLYLNKKTHTLALDNISLLLNHDRVSVDGVFGLDSAQHFHLHISAPSISYENAASALLEKTQPLLASFKVSQPIGIKVDMYGDTKYCSIPNISLLWSTKDNEITTPLGMISNCSFSGTFINEVKKGLTRTDDNSRIEINQFKGKLNRQTQIFSNNIIVTNLIHPIVHLELKTTCKLNDIDALINSNDFTLESGSAKINLVYDGPINDSASIAPEIEGSINLSDATIQYSQRRMRLTNCNTTLKFNHKSFEIVYLHANLGASSINISSTVSSFAPIFTHSREEMPIRIHVQSPMLDLNELIPFISKTNGDNGSLKARNKKLSGISRAMDEFTDKCNVRAYFFVKKIIFRHFAGENLNADVSVNNSNGWVINALGINQGAGRISFTGSINQDNSNKHLVVLKTIFTKIDIPRVFYSFNNFEIQSFNYTNLKGQVNLKGKLQLELDDKADVIPGTLKGDLNFQLKNGGILDFKPLEDIGKKIFPKRQFNDIEFAQLDANISISHKMIKMKRMEIASSALHLYIQGNYDLNGIGTDIVIQVPLNNISELENNKEPGNKGIDVKTGPSVYVHVMQNDKKEIQFKYNFSNKTKSISNNKNHDGK